MARSQFSSYLDRFGTPVNRDSLAVDSHRQEDLHLIDEALAPDPGIISPVAGTSPYPARSDHSHAFLDPPVVITGGTDVNASGNGYLILGDYGVTASLHFDNNEIQAFDSNGDPSNLLLNGAGPGESIVMGGDILFQSASHFVQFQGTGPHGLEYLESGIATSGIYYRTTPDQWSFENPGGHATLTVDTNGKYVVIDGDATNNALRIQGSDRPYISFYQGSTRRGYVGFPTTSGNYNIYVHSDGGSVVISDNLFSEGSVESDTGEYRFGNNHTTIERISNNLYFYIQIDSTTTQECINLGSTNMNMNVNINMATYNITNGGEIYAGGWFRSTVDGKGWINTVHNIGIKAEDSTWVQAHGGGFFGNTGMGGVLPATGSTSGYQYIMRNNSLNFFARYTSSARYKNSIQDIGPVGHIIDALRPRMFLLEPGEEEETPEQTLWREKDWEYGFIAEEACEVDDGKLGTFDAEDGELIPSAWRIPGVLTVAIRELQDLRKRVAALEAK